MDLSPCWEIEKVVLPQHTDHAGIMWHGSYLSWMEEGRINALNKVGLRYSSISSKGYELPVISLEIKYKLSIKHGDLIKIRSCFFRKKGITWTCKSNFQKSDGSIAADSSVDLVLVKIKDGKSLLIRNYPKDIEIGLLNLVRGPLLK